MIGADSQEVERKVLAILRILRESREPLGARVIARHLRDHGIDLTERAVRYHLKLMDERGLTALVGRDGRRITDQGVEELQSALVQDKVGFAISRIEILAFQTSFDPKTRAGLVPVNVSFYPVEKFRKVLSAMVPVCKAGLCAGNRVAVGREGERLGGMIVPEGRIGLATVCSVVTNGTLLKAGVPMDSRFGGILQLRRGQPVRFVELIHYAGSSLDPSEVFIRGKMTAVSQAARQGNGKILANFREVPSACRGVVEEVLAQLKEAGMGNVLVIGPTSAPVCEVPVHPGKIGMVLIGGMNPVAAAEEAGIEAENRAMAALLNYQDLVEFEALASEFKKSSKGEVRT